MAILYHKILNVFSNNSRCESFIFERNFVKSNEVTDDIALLLRTIQLLLFIKQLYLKEGTFRRIIITGAFRHFHFWVA